MPKAANHLDRCRLCDQNLRIFGTLQHVRSLVSKSNCTILTRLSSLGINLTLHEDTSTIICQKCFRNICKVEKTMHVLHAWKATTQTPAFGTPGEEVMKSQQGPVETGRDDTKTRCFNCDSLNEVPEKKRQREESPPTTGRGAKKRCNASTKSPEKNIMVEVVITYNPKLSHPKPGVGSPDNKGRTWKQKRKVIASEFSGMIENLAMGNMVTFAKLALTNENISQEIRKQIVNKIQVEVKAYASLPNVFEPCILSSTSLEKMKYFSYEALDNELSRKTPWLYTTINTATGGSTIHNCVAASVALRGRNPRLSALAYVINSTLTQGGVKPIFKRLSKMGIVTSYQCASSKQKEMKAAGYDINIKCWREDCELFFQHSVSGEVCPRPPPTAKPTEETGREEDEEKAKVEVGGPVEEEWGFLLGETETEEDRGSTVHEERGEEKDRGSLLGETETEEVGHASSALQGNDTQEEDSDSAVDSETEYFGLNLTCESD